ncbi:unnamed protein product [Ixodes hexagonus]
MPYSKDVCSVCSEPFTGRMQFLQCSGSCGTRFHCKCIDVLGDDYDFIMQSGSSTYKCVSCTKRNGSDEVSAITEKRPPEDSDVALVSTVLGNCSACGCVNDLLVALHDKIDSLVKQVVSVKAENVSLLLHLSKNTELLRRFTARNVEPRSTAAPSSQPGPESASFATVLRKDSPCRSVASTTLEASGSNFTSARLRTSTSAVVAGYSILPSAVTAPKASTDADGFTHIQRKKRVRPSSGSCASSKLSSAPRAPRPTALFVPRLNLGTTCSDVEEVLTAVLDAKSFICTKLKTRHENYSSFRIAVNEEDFDKVNNADVWPMGSLFRPFFGVVRRNDDRETATPN